VAWVTAPMIAIVCDNVIIHRSKIVQRWLAAHPRRIRLLHGARYSPHHNPVERIWDSFKGHQANTATLTMARRLRQVHAFRAHTPCSCWSPRASQLTVAAWRLRAELRGGCYLK